jgi:hypothetical protein
MPWNQQKCWNGSPPDFTNKDAEIALKNADFSNSVAVQMHRSNKTKSAFTYYHYKNWIICVVGHVHIADNRPKAGNGYIPGWDRWMMPTPQNQVDIILHLPEIAPGNFFNCLDRYPRKRSPA